MAFDANTVFPGAAMALPVGGALMAVAGGLGQLLAAHRRGVGPELEEAARPSVVDPDTRTA